MRKEQLQGINGAKLKTARIEAGFKIKDLRMKTGLTESSISLMENNKISPSVKTARLLAATLGISMDYLCDLDTPENGKILNVYNSLSSRDQLILVETARTLANIPHKVKK